MAINQAILDNAEIVLTFEIVLRQSIDHTIVKLLFCMIQSLRERLSAALVVCQAIESLSRLV